MKMPSIETEEEFADFVDNHDTTDFWDEFEDVPDVKVKRPKKKMISIRMYPYLISQIKQIAQKRQMPYQTLINQWLAEKASQEHAK
ncbi:TPA: hypothetical protein EYP66_23065 [Candidatus Poribacteria bacterium]|nr:hypothetical protein [Candidatus Poribacteria bacterium]